jgi:hypothetical protein
MKGAKVPVLLGRVVEAKPSCRPTELVVSLSGREGTPAEAVLRLQKPLAGKVEVGSEFRFEGVSTAFTREPFLLTMEVDPAEVKGLKTAPCRR